MFSVKIGNGKKIFLLLSFFLYLVWSCKAPNQEKDVLETQSEFDTLKISYAKGFHLLTKDGFYIIETTGTAREKNESVKYLMLSENATAPEWAADMVQVSWPLETLVTTSASHVALLSVFDAEHIVNGVSAQEHIFNGKIHHQIKEGRTHETGMDGSMNFEWILGNPPDLLMLSGGNSSMSDRYRILKESGIPVLTNSDWKESHVLGRAEWVKIMGILLNRYQEAVTFFEMVEDNYDAHKGLLQNTLNRPRILINNPFKGVWYMPGAESYIAELIQDAGADYIWSHLAGSNAHPLDFESVYETGVEADYWINPGTSNSMQHLLAQDQRFNDFKSVKEGKVFNSTRRLNQAGGNDYFEGAVLRPDLVLADLIHIFHPDLLPEHNSVYFELIK